MTKGGTIASDQQARKWLNSCETLYNKVPAQTAITYHSQTTKQRYQQRDSYAVDVRRGIINISERTQFT